MSLINCPECCKEISDKAEACPHCGLPSRFFAIASTQNYVKEPTVEFVKPDINPVFDNKATSPNDALKGFNAKEFRNALISFNGDYDALLSSQFFIDTKRKFQFTNTYEKYYKLLLNEWILQYLRTNAITLQIDDIALNRFITKMQHLNNDIEQNNILFVDKKIYELKDYFDHIMDDIVRISAKSATCFGPKRPGARANRPPLGGARG